MVGQLFQHISHELTYRIAFPRRSGREPGNSTAFLESQRHWGADRAHYAPIMFEYEPLRDRTSRPPGSWRHNGRLVIDYWLRPLQNFQDIPPVLSSEYEGEFMEPTQRGNKRIKHTDFRQRMYDFFLILLLSYSSSSTHPSFNSCPYGSFLPLIIFSVYL